MWFCQPFDCLLPCFWEILLDIQISLKDIGNHRHVKEVEFEILRNYLPWGTLKIELF